MDRREKAQLVIKGAAASVGGRLSYRQLEHLRRKLGHNTKTWYDIIQGLESEGVVKLIRVTQNLGSHNRPRNVVRIRGLILLRYWGKPFVQEAAP